MVLWTDLGVPTYMGNVYLTGYDVATIDLRLLFAAGLTDAHGQRRPGPDGPDQPQGQQSQDINFASCAGCCRRPPDRRRSASTSATAHTGRASPLWGGRCSGAPLGDNIARGFVTIDKVNQCSLLTSGVPGLLLARARGVVTGQNSLTGSFTFSTARRASATPAR